MAVFFFGDPVPAWWDLRELLGIQRVVDDLKSRGFPHEWPMKTVDINDPATVKAVVTAGSYKSRCPHYKGFWLCGGIGSVECAAFGGLLPGIVWYTTCEKRCEQCPLMEGKNGGAAV